MKRERRHFISRFWTQHLVATDETYFQHFKNAGYIGFMLLGASVAALVHAAIPFLFTTTASRIVTRLNDFIVQRQRNMPGQP